MNIETQRLIIREVRAEDGIFFAEMAADGSLCDVGFDKNCGRWMADWIAEAREFSDRDNPGRDYLAYTVALKGDGTVIGTVGCSYYEDLHETGITYFVGARYRENGYAAEAVREYIKYFFGHYEIQKLIATVKEENAPSWRTAEKAGFRLIEIRPYRDLNDEKEEMYRFYELAK